MATLVNKMNREVKVIIPNMREFRVFYSDNEGSTIFFKRDWEEEKTTEQEEQEWSEEDKKRMQSILFSIGYCKDEYPIKKDYSKDIDWLKSLRPQGSKDSLQTHWKPSKQEIDAFETALKGEFQNGVYPAVRLCELFQKLKKLYYNDKIPQWKPSEEQMEALEYVIRDYREDGCNATANYLQEILDHLKNM